jgi:CheY-like chemotaxis protein
MVLVVDDHTDMCEILSQLLGRNGTGVVCAYSGAAALNIMRSSTPQLVLLDLMMPDMTGADVIRAMRNDPALAAVPVVMYSASIEDSDREEALKLGAKDFLHKNGDFRKLIETVQRYINVA